MPASETFEAFYARTVWNVTGQLHEMAGGDSMADHAIREAYAKAYQQWYQVSGYPDSEGWVLATAKDAYQRRRAAGGVGSPAKPTDSGTWPGIYRPVAQPERHGRGQGQPPADPDATVAADPWWVDAGDDADIGAGAQSAGPAAWDYPAPGPVAGGRMADPTMAAAGMAGRTMAPDTGPSADRTNRLSGWLGTATRPTRLTRPPGPSGSSTGGAGPGGPGPSGPGAGLSRLGSRRNMIIAGAAVAALVVAVVAYGSGGHKAPTPAASRGGAAKSVGKPKPHMLAAGLTGRRSAIPWSLVGSGWALAEYSSAPPAAGGATSGSGSYTTYLVDPDGGKYVIATSSGGAAPQPIAWSGNGRVALLGPAAGGAAAGYSLLKVSSGHITPLQLPSDVSAVGFTRPDGLNILAVRQKAARFWLERYNLAGVFQGNLGWLPHKPGQVWPLNGCGYGCALSSPTGLFAVWGIFGDKMHLLSNSGGLIRKLHVPNSDSCVPLSWWNDTTILADCLVSNQPGDATQLWLVPTSKSAPTALTQPAAAGSGRIDGAWRADSRVYLTAVTSRTCQAAPSASVGLGISSANGAQPGSQISIPGTTGNVSTVVATAGRRLLVLAQTSCPGTSSLFWFNPSAGIATPVILAPSGQAGVIAAVPYGNGPTAVSTGQ